MNIKEVYKNNELPISYSRWWAEIADHLGSIYPLQDIDSPDFCSLDIGEIINRRKQKVDTIELDKIALVAKATNPHLFGNRTLLKGIIRAPWMSYPNKDGSWQTASLPQHGTKRPDPEIFINEFKNALLEEAKSYIKGVKTVGILLSGGMDSRVLAGVIREIQEDYGYSFSVVGLTWGRKNSRDIIYAKRITERFGWDWQHYSITADTLLNNIEIMAEMGPEVSPLHLHAMPKVSRTNGIDVVLAASYGDSVGRAEFSGRRVTQLKPILSERIDRFGLLNVDIVSLAKSELKLDVVNTPHINENTSQLRRYEIEREMHYMRRMLQYCMHSIARNKRFYQLFTSPDVFGRMWELDPAIRDDKWYIRLLNILPGSLLEIPWARTGFRYDYNNGSPDQYLRQFHSYGTWLREDLRDIVIKRANSERIKEIGIFNYRSLNNILRIWTRARTESTNSIDDFVSWLVSLDIFLETYQINVNATNINNSWKDRLSSLRGAANSIVYIEARNRFRN